MLRARSSAIRIGSCTRSSGNGEETVPGGRRAGTKPWTSSSTGCAPPAGSRSERGPGTDAALALGMMHVIVAERLYDREFVARHTVGFDELAAHVARHSPAWAAGVTGIPAERIAAFARRYATTKPAMILLGGSSMHKGANG